MEDRLRVIARDFSIKYGCVALGVHIATGPMLECMLRGLHDSVRRHRVSRYRSEQAGPTSCVLLSTYEATQ